MVVLPIRLAYSTQMLVFAFGREARATDEMGCDRLGHSFTMGSIRSNTTSRSSFEINNPCRYHSIFAGLQNRTGRLD